MRFHGWQLPYHPLQVSAVAVFFALSFAYYVFFVPFVGSPILLYTIIAFHSPLIASVFLLYVFCAAVDPADPGVVRSKKYRRLKKKRKNKQFSHGDVRTGGDLSNLSSVSAFELKNKEIESRDTEEEKDIFSLITSLACTPCATVSSSPENEYLFCSLCKVQIYQCSKHCRVCDKCVDGFDHHCRWLNNCIGKKNYRAFIALLISGMAMFIMQWSVGIWVIIRCFLYRRIFKEAIIFNLGSSFSLIPYLVIVGFCTILAMVATFPLVQLFFFHLLLIKKGLTTYDYIVAMREEDEQGMDATPSPCTSPASSISTANSGGSSSIVALQRASLCTPPHVFMDHEKSVIEADMVRAMRKENVKKKAAVSINPWALARLNTEDVKRAAAESRSNSSILRTLGVERNSEIFVKGSNIYCNTTSTPIDSSILARSSNGVWFPNESLDIRATMGLPLPLEARSDFCVNWPSSVGSSPASPEACFSKEDTHKPICELEYGIGSDGYDASGDESLDDND